VNSPVSSGIALLIASLDAGSCSEASWCALLSQTSLTQIVSSSESGTLDDFGQEQHDLDLRAHLSRALPLVVAADDHGAAFVVTARDMTPSEKKTFMRKAR
jgi:hypothetical protein